MKLRNKKTGEIVDDVQYRNYSFSDGFGLRTAEKDYKYKTLAKFVEDWEDYRPTEPLIEDEKVRELVADWAKLTQTTKILTVKRRTATGTRYIEFFSQDKCISISIQDESPKIKHWEEYPVEKLCGEDK